MAEAGSPFTPCKDGVQVRIRLTPKGGANRLGEVTLDADGQAWLRARVSAVAEKGKANRALIKLLSKSWGVGMQALTLIAGTKDRNKTVLVAGDTPAILQMLEVWLHSHRQG